MNILMYIVKDLTSTLAVDDIALIIKIFGEEGHLKPVLNHKVDQRSCLRGGSRMEPCRSVSVDENIKNFY